MFFVGVEKKMKNSGAMWVARQSVRIVETLILAWNILIPNDCHLWRIGKTMGPEASGKTNVGEEEKERLFFVMDAANLQGISANYSFSFWRLLQLWQR